MPLSKYKYFKTNRPRFLFVNLTNFLWYYFKVIYFRINNLCFGSLYAIPGYKVTQVNWHYVVRTGLAIPSKLGNLLLSSKAHTLSLIPTLDDVTRNYLHWKEYMINCQAHAGKQKRLILNIWIESKFLSLHSKFDRPAKLCRKKLQPIKTLKKM